MKYTIRSGVERPFLVHVKENFKYLIPLFVILAGVLSFLLIPHHGDGSRSSALGIYTVKTPDKNSGDKKAGGSGTGNTTKPNGTPASGATLSTQSSLPAVGGGLGGGTGGASGSIGSPTPTPTPVPVTGGTGGGGGTGTTTVSCVNQLTQTATLCVFPYQTCTMPLSGIIGYKTIDGTCIVIN
jgi:hypothetical protein